MNVFISWSGELSRNIAHALRPWLKLVAHYIEPWASDSDIEPGSRWSLELAHKLAQTNFGLLCVTAENAKSPWLLFEAGALAKSLEEGRVIPLLWNIQPKDLIGPLSQFQSLRLEKEDMLRLVRTLHSAQTSGTLDKEQTDVLFEALWPRLERTLTEIGKGVPTNKPAENATDRELLEAILESVKGRRWRVISESHALREMKEVWQYLAERVDWLEEEDRKLTEQDAPVGLTRQIEGAETARDAWEKAIRIIEPNWKHER